MQGVAGEIKETDSESKPVLQWNHIILFRAKMAPLALVIEKFGELLKPKKENNIVLC